MRNKQKIINIVGKSGSGKTTIAKELEKLGYNIIHSYTTREPREENEWGHTFINDWFPVYVSNTFVGIENSGNPDYTDLGVSNEFGLEDYEYIDINDMIAYKEIYEDHYFATKQQYQNKGTSIYIICPDGASQVKQNVEDAEVVTIYIQCDEDTRMYRMNHDATRNAKSINERLDKDKEVFRVCECDYVVDGNRKLDKVLEDVIEIIER